MTNPRKSLPSASGTLRLLNCPGSPAAEAAMPPEPELPDAARDAGTLIHAALAGDVSAIEALKPEQAEMRDRCDREEAEAAANFIPIEESMLICEKRLWMHGDKAQQIFSGQSDRMRIHAASRIATVADFKSGWFGCEPADQNAQIMALAVLIPLHFDVDEVIGIIVQPHAGGTSVVRYGPSELAQADQLLRAALTKAQEPDAPRCAGAWCKFCKAKAACPEGRAHAMAVEVYGAKPASLRDMTPAQRTQILDLCVKAEFFIDAWRKQAKEIEKEQPGSLGQWQLGKSRNTPSVDTERAWQSLSSVMPAESFVRCCKVSITGLRAEYQKAQKAAGQKCTVEESKSRIDQLLGDAVRYNQSEKPLERK